MQAVDEAVPLIVDLAVVERPEQRVAGRDVARIALQPVLVGPDDVVEHRRAVGHVALPSGGHQDQAVMGLFGGSVGHGSSRAAGFVRQS